MVPFVGQGPGGLQFYPAKRLRIRGRRPLRESDGTIFDEVPLEDRVFPAPSG
jgi:hypothetical protein